MIFTVISSDSTRVPPVTADRSPPDSRITGADSPVIADSSTDATPTTTSPSPGINSPALTTTISSARSFDPGTSSNVPSAFIRRACVSERALRSVSACAFPRPSAIASAKFAKSTVNHSHNVICSANPNSLVWCVISRSKSTVVTTAPTSTTNITGFFISVRGFSFFTESHNAPLTIPPVHSDFFGRFGLSLPLFGILIASGVIVISALIYLSSEYFSRMQQQVLQNRPQAQRRKECQRSYDQNHGNEERREERRSHWKSASSFGRDFLLRQVSGYRQHRKHHEKSSKQHVKRDRHVVPERVRAQARERRTVVRCA